MPTPLPQAVDNYSATLVSPHVANDGVLSLSVSPGTLAGGWYWIASALVNPNTTSEVSLGIFKATGNTGATLTGVTRLDASDVGLASGTAFQIRPTAEGQNALQTAVNALESANYLTPAERPYAAETLATATQLLIGCWGDSLTAGTGGTPYPTQLSSLIYRDCINNGVGGDTSTQIASLFAAAPSQWNYATVIWSGRNNFAALSTVMADIASMVASLGHTRYLVLTVLNAASEIIDTTPQTEVLALNAAILATYPANSLDIRTFLVNSYNPSLSQDVADHANNITPTSLRSDTVHLNTAGYLLVAEQIATQMAILDPPDSVLRPVNLGAAFACPAAPIGSVTPTAGTFTTLATAGSAAGINVTRRDTGALAWIIYSQSGNFGIFNANLVVDAFDVSMADNSAAFAGNLAAASFVSTGISDSAAPTPASGECVIYFSTNHLDANSAPKLCRKDSSNNITVIG